MPGCLGDPPALSWGLPDTEPEEEEVPQLEITYIDPESGEACSRKVYCDPEDWNHRYQARLLVSSDLVNSLSEAVANWFMRWKLIHQRLEDSRMGYSWELFHLRQQIQKMVDMDNAKSATQAQRTGSKNSAGGEEEEAEEEQAPKEVCPVHFFNVDIYLDSWTKEMLEKAVESFKKKLEADIKDILERIQVVGGGTWRQLLIYFMQKGTDPIQLVMSLLAAIEDPLDRREIVNTMTNGLQDLYDALLAKLQGLQVEEKEMNARRQEVFDWESRLKQAIGEVQKKMQGYKEQMEQPRFEEPPEEDDSSAVAEAQQEMFAQKEAGLKAYMLEVRRLKKLLEEWQAKAEAECDMEAIQKLQDEIKEWKRRRRMWEMRTDKYNEVAEEFDERISKIQEKIDKQKALQDEIRTKLAGMPGIDPGALKMKRMQREIKELEREERKIKAAMVLPNQRIKAMRVQLRDLYKKLGWEWDLSDSEGEDEGEEKPYWKRRKIAVNGFLPFNQKEFLYSEKDFHSRRQKRLNRTIEADKTKEIVAQMTAKRQGVLQSSTSRSLPFDEEEEVEEEQAGPTLFGKDEPGTDPIDPVQQAISAFTERLASLPGQREALSENPCWKQAKHAEQQENRQADLGRLLQLRESFEVQIQHCVECFVDMLPSSGSLGDLRSRLSGTLARLRSLPEDPMAWQAQDLEQEIQDTCENLQSMIEEAISHGDQVHPISAAMIHSVRFSDLRVLLSEVLQIERKLRETIRNNPTVRRRQTSQYEYSPPMTPSGQQGSFFPSMSSSPRPRGQTAPGGSIDDGSEGDFSLFLTLAAHSRSIPSPDELSDSLKLPARFMAQTQPLLGGRKPNKDARKKVDFGFRPDGAGEDSVENWSLFKVSKASTATSGFGDSVSTGLGLTTSSGFIGDKMRRTVTNVRRHKAEADCDFHEYMSQTRQMDEVTSWRSASAPSLLKQGPKKLCPPLPKLVHSGRTGRSLAAANAAVTGVRRGETLGTWGKSPPTVTLRCPVTCRVGSS